jgi:monolysocardiolipin acyltransferase
LDDPLVFGATLPIESFKNPNTKSFRWSLGAREVCHFNRIASLFFRLGKVCPIDRGRGVYQPIMNEIIEELNKGEWLHIFPEGKVNEEKKFLRLKWGVGRLIADAKVTPIVLPFYHLGIQFKSNAQTFILLN